MLINFYLCAFLSILKTKKNNLKGEKKTIYSRFHLNTTNILKSGENDIVENSMKNTVNVSYCNLLHIKLI